MPSTGIEPGIPQADALSPLLSQLSYAGVSDAATEMAPISSEIDIIFLSIIWMDITL